MKFYSAVLLALTMLPLTAIADEPAAIRLQEIEGRTWLVSPNGGPFFAHGAHFRATSNAFFHWMHSVLFENTKS